MRHVSDRGPTTKPPKGLVRYDIRIGLVQKRARTEGSRTPRRTFFYFIFMWDYGKGLQNWERIGKKSRFRHMHIDWGICVCFFFSFFFFFFLLVFICRDPPAWLLLLDCSLFVPTLFFFVGWDGWPAAQPSRQARGSGVGCLISEGILCEIMLVWFSCTV